MLSGALVGYVAVIVDFKLLAFHLSGTVDSVTLQERGHLMM
jgi:hypothetical protein